MRELICFSFAVFCVVPLLVPAFSLCSDLFPCSLGHTRNLLDDVSYTFSVPLLLAPLVKSNCDIPSMTVIFFNFAVFSTHVLWSVAVAGAVPKSFLNY